MIYFDACQSLNDLQRHRNRLFLLGVEMWNEHLMLWFKIGRIQLRDSVTFKRESNALFLSSRILSPQFPD